MPTTNPLSLSLSLSLLAIFLTTLHTTTAQSPPQFTPSISTPLSVSYNAIIIPAGTTIPNTLPVTTPKISLPPTSKTAKYIAILLDLTVAGVNPDGTNTTLLHWFLPNLTCSSLTTLSSTTQALTPYFPPSPPPGQTHTYGLFLFTQPSPFTIPSSFAQFFKNITAAPENPYARIGFNITDLANKAGLGVPVAADWFLVGGNNTMGSPSSTLVSTASATVASPFATGTGGYSVEVNTTTYVSGAGAENRELNLEVLGLFILGMAVVFVI